MRVRIGANRFGTVVAAVSAAAWFGFAANGALAQSQMMDDLLEKLRDKGVLSDDEYKALKKAREEELLEQRAERRRQAVKAAQDTEKEEKAKQATKVDINPGIRSIQLYGDVRVRYESRSADSTFPIAEAGGADSEQLDRWRYAVRIGIRGDLTDDWFYGLRVETSTNPRSPWNTFGNTNSNTGGGTSPYGKAGINVGQAYLGWKPASWVTLQAGKMPNPMYSTPMVWDPDINPEGIAEKFNFQLNDQWSLFGNFGQFVYSQFSPTENNSDLSFSSYEGYQYAWQGGVNYKFGDRKSVKIALSYYNYSGFGPPDFPGGANNNPNSSGFSGPFARGAQNTQPTNAAGLAFADGLNNLRYWDVPWEINFPISDLDARIFGDYAYNTQASDRAARGSYASAGSQSQAYQIGFQIGTNLGLVLNQAAAKKHTWEARAYWQSIALNSLDPNLTDSDFFEGRTNLQGLFFGFAWCPTDAIITTIRAGEAHRVNGSAPTPGSNPDIPAVQPISTFKIMQFDLTWKF